MVLKIMLLLAVAAACAFDAEFKSPIVLLLAFLVLIGILWICANEAMKDKSG